MTVDHAELNALCRLLTGSVAVWRLKASIEAISAEPPTVLVRGSRGGGVYVTRQAEGDLPPCWELRRADDPGSDRDVAGLPARRYAAVPGMLRGVRAALDPDARGGRLVIGARQA